MAVRGTAAASMAVCVVLLSACGESALTSAVTSPSPSASGTPSTSSVAAVAECSDTAVKPTDLAPVLRRGVPTAATLCFPGTDITSRTLNPRRSYAALRATRNLPDKNTLCPTDSTSANLVLRYADGTKGELLIEAACPSVVQPKYRVHGDRNRYFPDKYATLFVNYPQD